MYKRGHYTLYTKGMPLLTSRVTALLKSLISLLNEAEQGIHSCAKGKNLTIPKYFTFGVVSLETWKKPPASILPTDSGGRPQSIARENMRIAAYINVIRSWQNRDVSDILKCRPQGLYYSAIIINRSLWNPGTRASAGRRAARDRGPARPGLLIIALHYFLKIHSLFHRYLEGQLETTDRLFQRHRRVN